MTGEPPLRTRLLQAQSAWHPTRLDGVLRVFIVLAAVAALAFVLLAGLEHPAHGATLTPPAPQDAALAPMPRPRTCPPEIVRPPVQHLLLVAATLDGAERTQLAAFRDSLTSYFNADVQLIVANDFSERHLSGASGLVMFGNGAFAAPAKVRAALKAAQARRLPAAWVGLGGERFGAALHMDFDRTPSPQAPAEIAELRYNGVAIPVSGQPFAPAPSRRQPRWRRVLATAHAADGGSYPAILLERRFVYSGFLPMSVTEPNLALAATIDALSHVFGRHSRDPRILLRLEDIDATQYGGASATLGATVKFLLEQEVFIHLSVIPQTVKGFRPDGSEEPRDDIGAAHEVVRLVRDHPGGIDIVQHGFRHSRNDPRNAACPDSGCAYEFFQDDDATMGAAAAAALARQRLERGRDILAQQLRMPWMFEAPHYAMSPAEIAVAEEMFPLIMESPSFFDGVPDNFFMPWFTYRGRSTYAPSDAGYVAYDEKLSVEHILSALGDAAKVMRDPVLVVFYHPFMSAVPGRENDLAKFVSGARALGYRFTSACEALSPRY